MALAEPLIKPAEKKKGKSMAHTKASIFYGADEYIDELKKKFEVDHEIASLKALMPDGPDPNQGAAKANKDKILQIEKNDQNRSKKTGRLVPIPKKPDPMPADLAFLFTRITPEQMMYMWNIVTLVFSTQCALVVFYAILLANFPSYWWTCTLTFGLPFSYICIQHIYIDHDVMHGATFPPYNWQKYITHPFSDFFSLPYEEFVLEHQKHHSSTNDLLMQGEFGWDPEEFQYWLLEWTWRHGKKPFPIHPFGLVITGALVPLFHFFGLNDTGALFAIEWYLHFPEQATGGKCNKEFWRKWLPRRIAHTLFVWSVWAFVWMVGTYPLGRPLSEGWRFMLTVSFFARCGFAAAWMFITNFTHSHPWNKFLANDPERSWPILHNTMAFILGGKHRWNEMLFHDLHHAFPNAVGTLSQRGRFHGWQKVHDAAVEVLHRGLWTPNGDEETEMQKHARNRSMRIKASIIKK